MDLAPDAICFICLETNEVVIFGDCWAKPIYYSPDGTRFYELVQTGFGGNPVEFSLHYDNPHNGDQGQMSFKDNTLTWNDKSFISAACPSTLTFEPIPAVRQPLYLYINPDGRTFIYVSCDKYDRSQEMGRIYFGTANNMKRLEIQKWEAIRDGGTKYITTPLGVLYIPTPFDTKAVPSWNGRKIVALDVRDFAVQEHDDDTASIQKLDPGFVPPAILKIFE